MRDLPSKFAVIATVVPMVMTALAPVRADEVAGRGSILFLGVSAESSQSLLLTGQVAKHLRLGGYTVVDLKPQDVASRHCTDSDCLARLAQSYGAERILSAQVTSESGVANLIVGLYDKNRGTTQSPDACVECSVDAIGNKLGLLADNILVARPTPPPAGATQQAAATAPTPLAGPSRWTPGRIAGVTVLGVLAAVSIGAGAGLYALHGQPGNGPCTPPDSALPIDNTLCRYNTRGLAIAGFSVGAALGVGAVIVALIPFGQKKPNKASYQVGQ